MNHLPSALFVVDAKKESIAIREADRLNIPVFALLDTNTDPDMVDFPIPCNDDAFKSINVITHAVVDTIGESKAQQQEGQEVLQTEATEDLQKNNRETR